MPTWFALLTIPSTSIISIILAALLYPICNFLCKKEVEALPSDLIISSAAWYNSSLSPVSDELYQTAVEIIKSEGKASTSFLQRKLQIGYNRAARIIDMMEADGIVSKANHVGKRDVL